MFEYGVYYIVEQKRVKHNIRKKMMIDLIIINAYWLMPICVAGVIVFIKHKFFKKHQR